MPAAGNVLFLAGQAATAETVTIAPDATNPTEQDINGVVTSIVASGVELIRYTGIGGDDTLTVATGAGDDTARVEGGNSRDVVTSSSLPRIEFSGLNTFVLDILDGIDTATFATGNLNGAIRSNYHVVTTPGDTLVIDGFDTAAPGLGDVFNVTNPLGGLGDHLAVTHVNSANGPVTVTNTQAGAPVGRLQINTFGGDDTVNVDVNSPASGLIQATGITYDGGAGLDQLFIFGTPATAVDEVIYAPGPDVTRGQLFYENAANARLMTIEFQNLEPVSDLIPAATLTVHGTNSDNVIDYRASGTTTRGRVTRPFLCCARREPGSLCGRSQEVRLLGGRERRIAALQRVDHIMPAQCNLSTDGVVMDTTNTGVLRIAVCPIRMEPTEASFGTLSGFVGFEVLNDIKLSRMEGLGWQLVT
jgi:hypothetical protein